MEQSNSLSAAFNSSKKLTCCKLLKWNQ